MHTRLFAGTAALVLVTGVFYPTFLGHISVAYAVNAGGGESGGSSSSGAGAGTSGSSGGSGGHGSHRGHNMNVAFAIARWLAHQYAIDSTAPGAYGGGESTLTQNEINYVCSLKRSRVYPMIVEDYFYTYIGQLINKPASVIKAALDRPDACA